MRNTVIVLSILTFFVTSPTYALYSVADKGLWPDTWPKELESLRKQARTYDGPMLPQLHFEIPFESREQFEAAWPHLLTVKSKGAPIVLLPSPYTWLGNTKAGVWVHNPPKGSKQPEEPTKGNPNDRGRWYYTTYIELIVDGEVVDLNRIPLPPETPIIDLRFQDKEKKTAKSGHPAPKESGNLITNGSFETRDGGELPENITTLEPDQHDLVGWKVIAGPVDWIGPTRWTAAHGSWSLDLDGGIQQTVTTTPGQTYVLTFNLAGNVEVPPTAKSLLVHVNDHETPFSFDSAGKTASTMGWTRHRITFTAEKNATVITFLNAQPNAQSSGVALDDISLRLEES